MVPGLYYIIWTLIHAVYSFVKTLGCLWELLKVKCYDFTYHEDSIKNDVECISNSTKILTKIPNHVVLILGMEKPSYSDLSKLIMWCIAAGISFVSFYDHNGDLKKNEFELHKALSEKRKDIAGRIVWGRKAKAGTLYQNGFKNDCIDPVTVNLLSLGDGRGSLVALTRQLGKQALCGKITAAQVTIDLVNDHFRDVPDPELAIYCGDVCATYGLSPWQIRVTEFHRLSSHHNVKLKQFMNILHAYSKCEQRFGR